ncbi:hypothetical protein Lmor_1353 [Legionella moravica]|uniref:Uncharacterized protein n=1 Tax=Legionella moravica TaxID=39962 RepID=A0A378JYZ4_9GAMM|nr:MULTISPECIES: hypothetical protein [Legionella]KTD34820.1 hypothetical protein Lmor_1353 [Legionella moravica]STX63935.1 Uncharacterised protein [Legionella moravica]
MVKKSKWRNRTWLYSGIISGFLLGFFYFAFGVYTHSQGKVHSNLNHLNPEHVHAGSTQ